MNLTLYHGTRADRETLLREGLKRPDWEEVLSSIRDKFSLPSIRGTRLDRVRTFTRLELEYIYLTASKSQARGYSYLGGERALLLAEMLLGRKKSEETIADTLFSPNRWVVTVQIPEDWIENPEHIVMLHKYQESGYDPEDGTWAFIVNRDIPPNKIVSVEPVS